MSKRVKSQETTYHSQTIQLLSGFPHKRPITSLWYLRIRLADTTVRITMTRNRTSPKNRSTGVFKPSFSPL
jgi:hypothetical protein